MKNIVLIVLDTARGDVVHKLHEEDKFLTKETNTQFTSAYAVAPWTMPSHGSIFTGTYPSKHGAHAGHKYLDDTLTLLPEVLTQHGYETLAVSNNTWISEDFGFGRGFEDFYKTWQYVQSDTDLGRIARQEDGLNKLTEATKALFDGNPITNLTNAIYGQFVRKFEDDGATRTNEWIQNWLTTREESHPFFLFINYLEPHLEYRPPEEHATKYLPEGVTYEEAMEIPQDAWGYIADEVEMSNEDFEILDALYRAELDYLEGKINEIIDHLKAEGEWEDTLFIVTGDHGENIGDHDLMDHQYALYDTLLHVPLFVHGSPFKSGQINDIVQLVDIVPTILDVLDVESAELRKQSQGISFHPDADQEREQAIAEYMAPQPSMDALKKRLGDLPGRVCTFDRSLRTVRTDQYKYIRGSDGSQELYNIQSDSRETENIADSNLDITNRLDSKLDVWLNSFDQYDVVNDVSMNEETRDRLEDLGYLQ